MPVSDAFKGSAAALTNEQRARVAAFRFGLGPKAGTIAALTESSSPNAALDSLMAELDSYVAPAAYSPDKPPDDDLLDCSQSAANPTAAQAKSLDELAGRYLWLMEPNLGFAHRLALFWSNHFSISKNKSIPVNAVLGHFERTVIRANTLASFPEMLKAAIQHPAMIQYLDNQTSRKRTPPVPNPRNVAAILPIENLAREILELHTLGTYRFSPGAGPNYDQKSVEDLAAVLAGWSTAKNQFYYNSSFYEAGSYKVAGYTSTSPGKGQGLDILDKLARDKRTSMRLSWKLLRHFGWDNPPMSSVYRLSIAMYSSHFNLKKVAQALLLDEDLWTAELRIRPPYLWAVSMARALGLDTVDFMGFEPTQMMHWHWFALLGNLNNAPWGRITPDGYSDDSSEWLYDDALRVRVMVANQILRFAEQRHTALDKSWKLPDAVTLRNAVLPGSVAVTKRCTANVNDEVLTRLGLADLFLTSEFMTR